MLMATAPISGVYQRLRKLESAIMPRTANIYFFFLHRYIYCFSSFCVYSSGAENICVLKMNIDKIGDYFIIDNMMSTNQYTMVLSSPNKWLVFDLWCEYFQLGLSVCQNSWSYVSTWGPCNGTPQTNANDPQLEQRCDGPPLSRY